jgi:hypothetical protein
MYDEGSVRDELRPGTRLGDLEIVGHLADGEVARLWLAATRDHEGRRNALRLVRTIRGDLDDRARHEAILVADGLRAMRVRHRNVARTLAVVPEGPYVVEELVRGPTLARVARTLGRHGLRLPVAWGLRVAAGVARGLDAVHRAASEDGFSLGMLHENLNSSNVVLGRDGHPRIIDVGSTQLTRTSRADASLGVHASLRFVAPERLRHEPFDVRSDLYSLGVLLHDLVTGERLFDQASFVELAERTEPAVSIGERVAGLPEDLETWVGACLDVDPRQRPANASVLADVLEHFLTLLDAPAPNALGELARVIVRGPTSTLADLGLDPATGGARWSMSIELGPIDGSFSEGAHDEESEVTVVTDGPLEAGTVPSLDLHAVLRGAGFSDVSELREAAFDDTTRSDDEELARHVAFERALAARRAATPDSSEAVSATAPSPRRIRADDTVPFTFEAPDDGPTRDELLEDPAFGAPPSFEASSEPSSWAPPLVSSSEPASSVAPLDRPSESPKPASLEPHESPDVSPHGTPLVPATRPLDPTPFGSDGTFEPTWTATDTGSSLALDALWDPPPAEAPTVTDPTVTDQTRPSRAPSRARATEGELAVLDAMVSSDDSETLQAAIRRLLSHEWSTPIASRFQALLVRASSEVRTRALHTLWNQDADVAGRIAGPHLVRLVERADEPDDDEPVLLGAILGGTASGERVLDSLAVEGGAFAWLSSTHRRRLSIRAHAAAGFELVTRRSLRYSTPAARRAAIAVDERWQLRKRRSLPPP